MLHKLENIDSHEEELPKVSYGGICPHSRRYLYLLPDEKSIQAARLLIEFLISERGINQSIRVDWLYEPANGKMFGVLVCRNKKNEIGFLRAFSGEWEGRMLPDGWVPSSGFTNEYATERTIAEKKIDKLSQQIKELRALPKTLLVCNELEKKKKIRGDISRELTDKIHCAYRFKNTLGEILPLRNIFGNTSLPPTGMGDCCAPKLIQYAIRRNFEPLSMVEFWWGASSKVRPRLEGHFYSSCKPKCYPLLGFLLRGIRAAKEQP